MSAQLRGRAPRRAQRSSASTPAPGRTSGCFRMASRPTGSTGSVACRATRAVSCPTGKPARGEPAEESTSTPQRASRAETRRARPASGVTRAAVRPGVSSTSRKARAAIWAASSSLRAEISARPARPSAMGSTPSLAPSAFSVSICCSQSAVASAGLSASLTIRRRQRPRASPGLAGDQGLTAPRSTPAWARRRFIAPCGCWSPTSSQAGSARSWSRPGRMTRPCGAPETTESRAAVAGVDPVEPAAMRTPAGGLMAQLSASARVRATRRAATSIRPSSCRRSGQALTAKPRNSAETCQWRAISAATQSAGGASGQASSISTPSRNLPRASASSRAAVASSERPTRGAFSATSRASSKRRRQGEMAGGRSSAMSPGSKGGSPSSRSPRARICGSRSARPPPTSTKASARPRAARREGTSTTASASACGPRRAAPPAGPAARSARKGRGGAIVNQRGAGWPKRRHPRLSPSPPAQAA